MAEPSLIDRIAQLSPEQAQRAALAVYDELPSDALADGEKWELDELTVRARMLGQSAPDDVREAIERLLGPQAEQLKGELAQALLVELAAQPATTELVDNALEAVSSPDMLPIPLIIGAVLVYLATIKTREQTSTTVDPTTGAQTTTRTIERQNLASLSQLTGNVSDILTKLKGL